MKLLPTELECYNCEDGSTPTNDDLIFTMKVFDDITAEIKMNETLFCYAEIDDICSKIKEAYFQLFPEHLEAYNKLKEEK